MPSLFMFLMIIQIRYGHVETKNHSIRYLKPDQLTKSEQSPIPTPNLPELPNSTQIWVPAFGLPPEDTPCRPTSRQSWAALWRPPPQSYERSHHARLASIAVVTTHSYHPWLHPFVWGQGGRLNPWLCDVALRRGSVANFLQEPPEFIVPNYGPPPRTISHLYYYVSHWYMMFFHDTLM